MRPDTRPPRAKRNVSVSVIAGDGGPLIQINVRPQLLNVKEDTPYPGGPQIVGPGNLLREMAVRILMRTGLGPYEASIEALLENSPNRQLAAELPPW